MVDMMSSKRSTRSLYKYCLVFTAGIQIGFMIASSLRNNEIPTITTKVVDNLQPTIIKSNVSCSDDNNNNNMMTNNHQETSQTTKVDLNDETSLNVKSTPTATTEPPPVVPPVPPPSSQQQQQQQQSSTLSVGVVPKTIYMLWMQGFDDPSASKARYARRSFELMNPNYQFIGMDEYMVENLTDRQNIIPNITFHKLSVETKSDIYRILLLYKHGGIWTDASVNCGIPLDDWLFKNNDVVVDSSSSSSDLFTFVRRDKHSTKPPPATNQSIVPWITSWFLVTPPKGHFITQIYNHITNPNNFGIYKSEYFWFHRLVSKLIQSDPKMNMTSQKFQNANPLHCLVANYWSVAPIFKRCSATLFKTLFNYTDECCGNNKNSNNQTTQTQTICDNWDCRVLAPNAKLLPKKLLVKDHL